MLCKKTSVSFQSTIILTMVFGLWQKLFSSSVIPSILSSSFLPISPELFHPSLPHSRSLSFHSHAASISLILLNLLNMWSLKSNLSCVVSPILGQILLLFLIQGLWRRPAQSNMAKFMIPPSQLSWAVPSCPPRPAALCCAVTAHCHAAPASLPASQSCPWWLCPGQCQWDVGAVPSWAAWAVAALGNPYFLRPRKR